MTAIHSEVVESAVEIGGYFSLELPDYGDQFSASIKFQSCRAALRAVLESAGITRVLLPAYICDSVIQAVIDAGATVRIYELDESLYPTIFPDRDSDQQVLLYVNYFGLCQENVNRLLKDISSRQLIVDNSHALFAKPTKALATIYSPRKFIAVPDGGLLITSDLTVTEPENEDSNSINRMKHLFLRMAYKAQNGYANYLEAEISLLDTRPLRMSHLTRRILNSHNIETVKHRRRENYLMLASRLDKYNQHRWTLDSESVPLCYPLMLKIELEHLKRNLVKKGIYIPTYWIEANSRIQPNSIEYLLTNYCLAIPCDQRYSPEQMTFLADEIISNHVCE
jgi:hypothetical protein